MPVDPELTTARQRSQTTSNRNPQISEAGVGLLRRSDVQCADYRGAGVSLSGRCRALPGDVVLLASCETDVINGRETCVRVGACTRSQRGRRDSLCPEGEVSSAAIAVHKAAAVVNPAVT